MKISFDIFAWEDYLFWQKTDKKILKRINILIKDIVRNPLEGLGKAEKLRGNLSGCYSRRITQEHRIVYTVLEKNQEIVILQCRYHYS